jgi:hypothetical protein
MTTTSNEGAPDNTEHTVPITFMLPYRQIKELQGLGYMHGVERGDVGITLSDEVAAATEEYVADRKAQPGFPEEVAAAKERIASEATDPLLDLTR